MKIAVYGTGGIGGFFGGKLAQAGEDVTFIARGAHLAAIRQQGLRVESILGDFSIQPAAAEQDPAAVGVVDVVIVGVKAWQVPEAALAMRPMVGDGTLVVPLQNGVDAPGQLAQVLEDGSASPHVVGGLCRVFSMIAAPGVIRHGGIEPYIAFNRLDGQSDERIERLREVFTRVGVKVDVPADVTAALWAKFNFIASFSGVAAVSRAPAGVVRAVPQARALVRAAAEENAAVGAARGVRLPADLAARTLALVDNIPDDTTASMQRDIMEGRPSELESQNGAVVLMGRDMGVDTPVNSFLYACLLPQEMAARGHLI